MLRLEWKKTVRLKEEPSKYNYNIKCYANANRFTWNNTVFFTLKLLVHASSKRVSYFIWRKLNRFIFPLLWIWTLKMYTDDQNVFHRCALFCAMLSSLNAMCACVHVSQINNYWILWIISRNATPKNVNAMELRALWAQSDQLECLDRKARLEKLDLMVWPLF